MKKWFLYGGIFSSIYLIFVIATMPATFVLSFVELPKNVKINNVEGSIWHSSIKQVQYQREVINNVEIDVNMLSLLVFNPTANITFGGDFIKGPEGTLSASGLLSDITISDLTLQLPANKISEQFSLPLPVTAHSYIDISIEKFVVGKPYCQQAQGDVSWSKAAITALDEKVELGSLKAKLSCQQGAVALEFEPDNNLGLTFTLTLAKNNISGNGYLIPGNKFPKQLNDILPFLGKADNNGRYKLYF